MKRRILPIPLSAVLAVAMPITSFAAPAKRDLSPAEAQEIANKHDYRAYEILVGNINANDELAEIEFGSDWSTDIENALVDVKIIKAGATPKEVAEAFSTFDSTTAEGIAEAIAKVVPKDGGYAVAADKTITGTTLTKDAGYYLIVDVTTGLEGDDSVYINRSQLQVVKKGAAVAINAKLEAIQSWKGVKDVNDSTGEADADWQKSADYDIGDEIPFMIAATVPHDIAYYGEYTYVFHDDQSEGLTFKQIDKVTLDGTPVDEKFYDAVDDGNDFTVTFADITKIPGIKGNSELVVEYTSTLNDKAVFGETGNPNEFYIEFTNDKGGKGKTPVDIAIVFTFKTTVLKLDGKDKKELKGAEFTLEKLVKGEAGQEATWEKTAKQPTMTGNSEVEGESVKFTAEGLDDGIYRLTETKVPNGFNGIAPIYFEVKVTHVYDVDPTKRLTIQVLSLDGEDLTNADTTIGDLGDLTPHFTATTSTGAIDTSIINQNGVVLPSTGGIGTTIFYVIGGVLVVGAVVLLIVRRRMRNEEE